MKSEEIYRVQEAAVPEDEWTWHWQVWFKEDHIYCVTDSEFRAKRIAEFLSQEYTDASE